MNIDEIINSIGKEKFIGESVEVDVGLLAKTNLPLARLLTGNVHDLYDVEHDLSKRFRKRIRLHLTSLPSTLNLAAINQGSYENKIIQFRGIVIDERTSALIAELIHRSGEDRVGPSREQAIDGPKVLGGDHGHEHSARQPDGEKEDCQPALHYFLRIWPFAVR